MNRPLALFGLAVVGLVAGALIARVCLCCRAAAGLVELRDDPYAEAFGSDPWLTATVTHPASCTCHGRTFAPWAGRTTGSALARPWLNEDRAIAA